MDRECHAFFIVHLVGNEMGDRLLAENPDIKYVEARHQIERELDALFQKYDGRLEEYLEERSREFLEKIEV